MKRILVITAVMLSYCWAAAQGVFIHNAVDLDIGSGVYLQVEGAWASAPTSEINNSGMISLSGDWTEDQLAGYNGNGWLNFIGANTQNITTYSIIANIKVDNNDFLILGDSLDVSDTLDLNFNGSVSTGDYLLNMSAGAVIANYDDNHYIQTNGSGSLAQQAGPADGNVIFPVGNISYNPAIINNSGIADVYLVNLADFVLKNGTTGPQQLSHVVDRAWNIVERINGGSNATLILQWDQSQETTLFNRAQSYISQWDGSQWVAAAASGPASNVSGSIWIQQASGITTFSPFRIESECDSIVANCKDITIDLDDFGGATIVPSDIDLGSGAVCDSVSLTIDKNTFTCADVGAAVAVNLVLSDSSGNSDTCTANVTVRDVTAPIAVCNDLTINLNNAGNASIQPVNLSFILLDVCGVVSLSASDTLFDCNDVGFNVVQLYASDNAGNIGTCNSSVRVNDITPPETGCPGDTVILADSNSCVTVFQYPTPVPTDNCSIDTFFFYSGIGSGGVYPLGTNTETYVSVDPSGNTDTCSFNVTVNDTFAPDLINLGVQKVLSSNGAAFDYFGGGVAISGNYAIIGAGDNIGTGANSGAAYIFQKVKSVWKEQQILLPSNPTGNDLFGISVAIEGDWAIAGSAFENAPLSDAGAVYVYQKNGSSWLQTQRLTASDAQTGDRFGVSVSISGNWLLIGANTVDDNGSASGAAYIFEWNGSIWVERQKLLASDGQAGDLFGSSVSVSGNKAVFGAEQEDDNGNVAGAAYTFEFNGSSWIETQKLLASDGVSLDLFGSSVGISGDRILVGAQGYDDTFTGQGAVYAYEWNGSSWLEIQKILASDPNAFADFGTNLSLSGNRALIGAPDDNAAANDAGAAYFFEWKNGQWHETLKVTAPDPQVGHRFGANVALEGNVGIVGAIEDNDNGNSAGAAYFYQSSGEDTCQMALDRIILDTAVCDTVLTFSNLRIVDLCNDSLLIEWDFNDDNVTDFTGENPSLTYVDGSYSLKVTVTDGSGNSVSCREDFSVEHVDQITLAGGSEYCSFDSVMFLIEEASAVNVFMTLNGVIPIGPFLITDSMKLPLSAINALLYRPDNFLVLTHLYPSDTSCSYNDTLPIIIKSDSLCLCDYTLSSPDSLSCSDDTFTVWLQADIPVTIGMIGMEACINYDPTIVQPTGTGQAGAVALASSPNVDVFITNDIPGRVNVATYYNASAPANSTFQGVGPIMGIDFVVNGFANGQSNTIFEVCEVLEAFTLFDRNKCGNPDTSVLNIPVGDTFSGRISYWTDINRPLQYDQGNPGTYLRTDINESNCMLPFDMVSNATTTDLNGEFSLSSVTGNDFQINRDITGDFALAGINTALCTNVMAEINGFDSYLAAKVSTYSIFDPTTGNNFIPSPFQMIASDVNMDDKVSVADVSLIMQRSVNQICEYPQGWNYTNTVVIPPRPPAGGASSKDWRFVDEQTYLMDDDYRIEISYPTYSSANAISNGYWKNDVPNVPLCFTTQFPADPCIDYMDYYAVMLGDIDGNWSLASANSRSNNGMITVDFANAVEIGSNHWKVPVYASFDNMIVSVDLDLGHDQSIEVADLELTGYGQKINLKYSWKDHENDQLLVSSYSLQKIDDDMAIYWLVLDADAIENMDQQFTANAGYINGLPASVVFNTSTGTITEDYIESQLMVYPNPTKDQVNIEIIGNHSGKDIALFDMQGRMLQHTVLQSGETLTTLDLSAYASATYIVKIVSGDGTEVVKVVKE